MCGHRQDNLLLRGRDRRGSLSGNRLSSRSEDHEIATPIRGKKPHDRAYCCLCAIGSRMIMFGGEGGLKELPRHRIQSGAIQEGEHNWSNDIYELQFEEGNEKGK